MPWDINDYPDSMKNFEPLLRKKAIDIANALEAEGYPESRLLPIAQAQAQEWFDNASEQEKQEFEKEANPKKTDVHDSTANVDLLDNDVEVYFEDDVWKVKTVDAKRAEQTFSKKQEAVTRGQELAENKESSLLIYKQDGTIQKRQQFG